MFNKWPHLTMARFPKSETVGFGAGFLVSFVTKVAVVNRLKET